MKKLIKFIALTSLAICVTSCTSTKTIQKNMNMKSFSMSYLKDSKVAEVKKEIGISVDSVYFEPSIMRDSTQVIKKNGWFIPLLVFNIWKSEANCYQGKNMFAENIPDFIKTSLMEEIDRSGNVYADYSAKSPYKIELSVDEMKTEGPYLSSGFFYFLIYVYGYGYSDVAGPAVSKLTISYKIKKGDDVLLSNTYEIDKLTEQINKRYTNLQILQQDYAVSMVEAASMNIKSAVEKIVNDLNVYFNSQP
jgi:hypothetical protein